MEQKRSGKRTRRAQERNLAFREQARRRVESAWHCAAVLRPELLPKERKALAAALLNLSNSFDATPVPPIRISAAQVTEMVWRNSRCINPHCPMLLFSDQLAEEINELLRQELDRTG